MAIAEGLVSNPKGHGELGRLLEANEKAAETTKPKCGKDTGTLRLLLEANEKVTDVEK